jgi:L-ascorbate metabolism protein UlaG (beta-lactamase superfamily)
MSAASFHIVVPAAEAAKALARGVPAHRLIGVDAGETLALGPDLSLTTLPAAHEDLRRDNAGRHLFLGYVLRLCGGPALYHSGDCVPYPGLAGRVSELSPDLALLPINGRDAYRLSRGVPGNFTIAEAVGLCEEASVPELLAHHFGMFAENTVDLAVAEASLAKRPPTLGARLASLATLYRLD